MATGVGAWSTLAATNSAADSTINWAEGQAPSTVNDSARAMMAGLATFVRDGSWIQFQDQSHTVVSSTKTKIEGRNLTAYYPANRRVRFVVGANTTYGLVASSSFNTDTSLTYTLDTSGSLSATAYAVSVALADAKANPPLASAFLSFTRDLTAATGSVAYTTVGFTPTAVIIFGAIASTAFCSYGFTDSARSGGAFAGGNAAIGQWTFNTTPIYISSGVAFTDTQTATVSSYDNDGFTLSWTKTGSPTGTAQFYALCLK
jgi:hypothetical protein